MSAAFKEAFGQNEEAKEAIATILRCMEEAEAAFAVLSNAQRDACLDYHSEGCSINHCLRWGQQAAQELNEILSEE